MSKSSKRDDKAGKGLAQWRHFFRRFTERLERNIDSKDLASILKQIEKAERLRLTQKQRGRTRRAGVILDDKRFLIIYNKLDHSLVTIFEASDEHKHLFVETTKNSAYQDEKEAYFEKVKVEYKRKVKRKPGNKKSKKL